MPDGQKTVWTFLFFCLFLLFFFFFVLNIFYGLHRGSNGFITEKTILFQGSRGGPTFSRGGGVSNFFQEGGGGSKYKFL